MTEVLLRLRHGSQLYGTAHAGSDEDWYEVVVGEPSGNPWTTRYGLSEQLLDGREDVVRKDLGQWVREFQAGVPQAAEAAWAPDDAVEVDLIRPFRLGLRLGSDGWTRHRRAMRNFASGYWDGGDASGTLGYAMKRARHAVRLARNMDQLGRRGMYDPRLRPEEWEACKRVADNLSWGDELLQTCDWIALGGAR